MTAVTPEGDDLNVSVLSDIFPVIPAAETLVASTSTHACAVLSGASNDCGSSAAYTCVPDAKQMKKAKMIDTAEIREDSLALLSKYSIETCTSPSSFFSSDSVVCNYLLGSLV